VLALFLEQVAAMVAPEVEDGDQRKAAWENRGQTRDQMAAVPWDTKWKAVIEHRSSPKAAEFPQAV